MNPRHRRLLADADLMRTEFAGHPVVTVEPQGFDPPEQYRVVFRLPSARLDPSTNQPTVAHEHRVLITLPSSYPRDKPYCVTETPVFHPNFGVKTGEEICIGDFWTPAQTLVDIVAKIGEMLQFQTYNVRSPLNALAAQWVAENEQVFPLGTLMLFQAEPEISLSSDLSAGGEAGSGDEIGNATGPGHVGSPGAGPEGTATTTVTPASGAGFDEVAASRPAVHNAGGGDGVVVVEIVDDPQPRTTGAPTSQGDGWWQASDGRWYPPELAAEPTPGSRGGEA